MSPAELQAQLGLELATVIRQLAHESDPEKRSRLLELQRSAENLQREMVAARSASTTRRAAAVADVRARLLELHAEVPCVSV